jgi:hypothetical protein
MGKPKKGMKVTHTSTNQTGVVSAVIRGIVHVVFPDGSKGSAPAGTFHKSGGGWISKLFGGK